MKTAPKILLPLCCLGLLAGASAACAAETLGRLFFTPEQRVQLERQERQQPRGNVRINGYLLTLPSGKATAWIDGKPVAAREGSELHLDANDTAVSSITITNARGSKSRAHVGDAVDPESGAVQPNAPAHIQRNPAKAQ
ncbi:MAG: hypothetical protein EPO06_04420 [Burkholderiaceae bacterium]|nr:MAG: hypothetical protein EPO06_04420 [Burkholderiaceae bacterium]